MSDEKKPDEPAAPATDFEAIAKENAAKKKKREQERAEANRRVLKNYRIKNP